MAAVLSVFMSTIGEDGLLTTAEAAIDKSEFCDDDDACFVLRVVLDLRVGAVHLLLVGLQPVIDATEFVSVRALVDE